MIRFAAAVLLAFSTSGAAFPTAPARPIQVTALIVNPDMRTLFAKNLDLMHHQLATELAMLLNTLFPYWTFEAGAALPQATGSGPPSIDIVPVPASIGPPVIPLYRATLTIGEPPFPELYANRRPRDDRDQISLTLAFFSNDLLLGSYDFVWESDGLGHSATIVGQILASLAPKLEKTSTGLQYETLTRYPIGYSSEWVDMSLRDVWLDLDKHRFLNLSQSTFGLFSPSVWQKLPRYFLGASGTGRWTPRPLEATHIGLLAKAAQLCRFGSNDPCMTLTDSPPTDISLVYLLEYKTPAAVDSPITIDPSIHVSTSGMEPLPKRH